MKIIVFDTETNGLIPKNMDIVTDNLEFLPYIVQLSYILFDTNSMKILVKHDFIIKLPEHVQISEKCVEVHGISKQISTIQGISIIDALSNFQICLKQAQVVIGHNITFDIVVEQFLILFITLINFSNHIKSELAIWIY